MPLVLGNTKVSLFNFGLAHAVELLTSFPHCRDRKEKIITSHIANEKDLCITEEVSGESYIPVSQFGSDFIQE